MRAAEILLRELRDPRLSGVHFTRVEVSRDSAHAKLWFRTMPGGAAREEAEAAAGSAARFLRRELARGLRRRQVPEIELLYDELPDEGRRIEELLAAARREPAGAGGHVADDEE